MGKATDRPGLILASSETPYGICFAAGEARPYFALAGSWRRQIDSGRTSLEGSADA